MERIIDLTTRQRAIVAQLTADEQQLADLREQERNLLARINANRGKLEFIAELAAEYGSTGGNDARDTDPPG